MSACVVINALILPLSFACTITGTSRVVKSKSVEGVALLTTSLSLYACLTWAFYATMTGNVTQVITSSLASTGCLTVLVIAHQTRVLHFGRVALGLATYATLAAVLTYFAGTAGLGIAVSSLTFITRLPQTLLAWRRPGGKGVSTASQSLDAFQSVLWTLTGISRGDIWLAVSSFYSLCNASFVAIRTTTARRGKIISLPKQALSRLNTLYAS